MSAFTIAGQLADVWKKEIYPAEITVSAGKIIAITPLPVTTSTQSLPYILPGFVDSHVHIESSMLVPSEFARLAVVHGTIATVSDPHEIANVCGIEGVHFMIRNGRQTPFKFNFGAPSCVPATTFETAGATLDTQAVTDLLAMDEIRYLSEMMNFPGVLMKDPEVTNKIAAAHAAGKPVDGHAPGLRGEQARAYIAAGISTDHECFTAEEALDKLQYGMKILIREGSAAKNFDALAGLLNEHADNMMFCSDDKHPDSLVAGHINQLCARAVARNIPLFHVLQAACVNPVLHYNLTMGLLREGDAADFIVVKDLIHFEVKQTWIDGVLVADKGKSLLGSQSVQPINQFNCRPVDASVLAVPFTGQKTIQVIEALDGQLITNKGVYQPLVANSLIVSDTTRDLLKIAVINRYNPAPVAIAWVKNFGLQRGAIASSVAHDSHNIIAVGADDESLAAAINLVIEAEGGVSCVVPGEEAQVIALPVAGLMSAEDGYKVAADYTRIDQQAKAAGATLGSPFMTLSFMALLVIPHLKLSDLGLFDGDSFTFTA